MASSGLCFLLNGGGAEHPGVRGRASPAYSAVPKSTTRKLPKSVSNFSEKFYKPNCILFQVLLHLTCRKGRIVWNPFKGGGIVKYLCILLTIIRVNQDKVALLLQLHCFKLS